MIMPLNPLTCCVTKISPGVTAPCRQLVTLGVVTSVLTKVRIGIAAGPVVAGVVGHVPPSVH